MKKITLLIIGLLFSSALVQAQKVELDRLMNLRGYWKFSIGDREEWADPNYDDSDWEEIYVPRRWEREGFNGYDGYAWYRTSFEGRKLDEEDVHYIRLGYIDDVDEVYVNGVKIGFSGGFPPDYYTAWNAEREYRIPDEALNYNGENVIAVRVYDKGGEGGIYSGEVGLLVADRAYRDIHDLEGIWKIRLRDEPEFADPDFDDSGWADIIVPSNWRTIGISDLRDFAWYRKEFNIRRGTDMDDLILIGGRIDDFDEIFINGEKIGETNDGGRLGRSRSFSELRVYNIPKGLLKEGKNVVAVRVEDIGDNGGIYEGPVVIIPSKLRTRYTRTSYSWWR